MSGHSKWSTIKHKKGANDAKRAQIFSRASKLIILAAQSGGGDPETNYALKTAIDGARKVNMPKDNIDRAIKSALGGDGANRIEEVVYEAMGPEGSAFIILCATDNTNRSITEVKTALKKNAGKFVPSGSVSFNFAHVGLIIIKPDDFDTAELAAIDAGAIDVKKNEDMLIVTTEVSDFHAIQTALASAGYEIKESLLSYEPSQIVTLSDGAKTVYETLYEILDDLDDVQDIFTNVA